MSRKKKNDKKQVLDETEIKKQIELQKLADKQKEEDEQKIRKHVEEEKPSLLNFWIEQAEARSPKNKKKRNEQDEKLKRYLTGVGVTSNEEQDEIIAKFKQPYVPHFQYEKGYYKEIFRLNLWNEDDANKFFKPREVAVWTVRLIYGRFMKELPTLMDELRAKNKYIGFCVRRYKFFQFLTPEAQLKLDSFIDECINMMKLYNNWESFEKDYCDKHKLSYQKRLF